MTRSLLRNSLANFGAAALPAVAMLVTLPFIVHRLGTEAYGVLTMVMAITGYFAVVDVNVTAASVKFISEHHARGEYAQVDEVIVFGTCFYLAIGLIGGLGVSVAAPWLVQALFNGLPADKHDLAVTVMRLAGAGFVVGQLQTYWNCIPQALQRYDVSAKAEAFFGTLLPLATVGLLMAGFGLVEIVLLRVVVGAIHAVTLLVFGLALLPSFQLRSPSAATRRSLWAFSGYSYLSRLAAMSHAQGDKMIVGGLLGMSALAFYAVATQIVGRITTLTFRLSSVLFPAASALQARGELDRLRDIYFVATRYVTFLNGAAILMVCLFGRELLHYWMGPDFAARGYAVMVCAALGLLFDSLTTLPSLVNDAFGKPRNTGLFAVGRAALTLLLVWLLALYTHDIGLVALGHTVAAAVFAALFLIYIHGAILPWRLRDVACAGYASTAAVCLPLAIAMLVRPASALPLLWAGLLGAALLLLLVVAAYGWILLPAHRQALRAKFLRRSADVL